MAPTSNKTFVFKDIPETFIEAGKHVTVEDRPIDLDTVPLDGGVLIKVFYISQDPYLRGRMRDPKIPSYFPAIKVGQPVESAIVGKVVRSDSSQYQAGDLVATFNAQNAEYTVIPEAFMAVTGLRKIKNPHNLPLSYFAGFLGMPGLTVYEGLYNIGQPKKGETIFVSSAAGVVGQMVGQIAKAEGLKVIGAAGSDEKVEFVKSLGFDEVFNYKKETPMDALKRLAPNGIDIYWDNVGEDFLEAALENINRHARIIGCGAIANYNTPLEQRKGVRNYFNIIPKNARMEGFLCSLSVDRTSVMLDKFAPLFANGSLKAKEDITEGIEGAPEALTSLFSGKNFGKAIVKVADA